jgi:DNA-binding transcriptional MerR regulator
MGERRWRIGELAEAAGMTVRALHHYEQIGLLVPAARTSGDHRLYGEADVERLYRIRALRGLGMPLDDIRRALDDGAALAEVLRAHLDRVEVELERVTQLRDRLRSITSDGCAGSDDLLATLNAMSRVERHAHERIEQHTQARGPLSERGDAESQWRAVADRLRACMAAGDAPDSERATAAAADARELIEAFANGDAGILEALARLRENDPPRDLAGWDPELTRYLHRALAALGNGRRTTDTSRERNHVD